MLRLPLAAILALPLCACWGPAGHLSFSGEPPGDNEVWRPNSDTGPEDSDEPDTLDGVDPVIDSADAWCYTSDDAGDWWGLKATGDDPQGSQTLQAFVADGVEILDNSGFTIATLALVCEENGQCWGSAQCEHIDVYCSNPQGYSFLFVVEDEQGHRSETATVQGRYGSGPTG
jgi:hypothetical protein